MTEEISLVEKTPATPAAGTQRGARRLRVLFLNTRDIVGADVAVHLSLARTLDRAHAQVWAATNAYEAPGASARAALESIPDLIVLPLDLGRPLVGRRGYERAIALVHNGRAAASLARLAWLCRCWRVDIVHVTERPRDARFGLLLARLAGSACLIHAHTGYYRHDATRLGDWTLRHADAVVGVSHFTADTYRHGASLPPGRVFAVHNAVDSAVFRPDAPVAERLDMRARLGVPAGAPLIGCVARLSRWKDQATLLEALVAVRRTVPGARLVLAGANADTSPDGRGNYEDYLARRIGALGLEGAVTFAGFVPHHEMPHVYAALDLLAHPAVEEPFGLAIVEAMASGLPVVAVNAGGVPEIIRDGVDGLLVPRGQPSALAAAITRVLGDTALSARLGRAGRERARTVFTPGSQAAAMLDVYRRVTASRLDGGAWEPHEGKFLS